jgi:hypothetical protein
MEWDPSRWDQGLLQNYRQMGELRRSLRALTTGDVINLTPAGDPDVFALARSCASPRDTVVAAFNRSEQTREFPLFVAVGGLVDGLPMTDVLSQGSCAIRNGVLDVVVPPRGAVILVPAPEAVAGYRFFKDR